MSLDALKIENNINDFLQKCKDVFPDSMYVPKFSTEEFSDSSKWDLEYLPQDIRKMRFKKKIFKYIHNNSFEKLLKKFKKYPQSNELETSFTEEVNSSVLSDICSNMCSYGCTLPEALKIAESENNSNLELTKLKLNILKRNLEICKNLDININFKMG